MLKVSAYGGRGALVAAVPVLIFAASPAQQAQRAKPRNAAAIPESVEWRPGPYADALREASERNVPVILSFLPREPSLHARVRLGLFRNPEFRAVAADCIPLLALDGEHPQAGGDPATAPCPFFPTIRCADHVQLARTVFPIFAENDVLFPPVHFVLAPSGELFERIENSEKQEGEPARDAKIVAAAQAAVKKAGLGLDREEHARRVTQIREAEAALAADDFAKAWNLLESVKREVERGALCAQAATAAEAVAKRVEELLDQADAQVGAGEITAAYDTYSQVEAVFRKTELGKRAQKEKGRLERGKETGEIIRAHKIAIEAEELLRKAEALEGQGDPARALRIYEQILERFADTPAAQNARIRAKALRGGTGS